MICPHCHTENEDAAPRCATCGRALFTAPPIGPGAIVAGRYEILDHLGSGGMGMVFKARDRALDELVAIKVLRTDPSLDPDLENRFRSEIKLAWKVRHRNVCGIHEYGEDGNLLYISMELVEGRNLRQLLREQGALLWEDAYEVALQVAEGLKAIHEAGVIHRDLKTANIIRDERGLVRLLDFGIAKVWRDESGSGITGTGKVVGSPEYMSPEQVRGAKVDFRSDIYALGVVLFEIFTGRVPFRADTPVATMLLHLQSEPPLDVPEAVQIPAALVPVLRKALAKDPDERYASCEDVVAALRQARSALQHQTTDLLSVGAPAPRASPVRDADRQHGVLAASALATARPAPRSPYARLLVPSLIKALAHPAETVRADAAQALGNVGPDAKAAVAALVAALEDGAWAVRMQAAHALGIIGADAADAVTALSVAQGDVDTRVRAAAAAAVARLGAAAPPPSPLRRAGSIFPQRRPAPHRARSRAPGPRLLLPSWHGLPRSRVCRLPRPQRSHDLPRSGTSRFRRWPRHHRHHAARWRRPCLRPPLQRKRGHIRCRSCGSLSSQRRRGSP